MKKKWLVLLAILTVVFAASGIYLLSGPRWIKGADYNYYNEAFSMYLEGKLEDSLAQFTYVASNTEDLWLKSLALSQLGYIIGSQAFDERFTAESRYQIARYSIEILKEAVISNPNNGEAKYNLELLLDQLPKLSQQMEENGDSGGDESNPDPGYSHGEGERGY